DRPLVDGLVLGAVASAIALARRGSGHRRRHPADLDLSQPRKKPHRYGGHEEGPYTRDHRPVSLGAASLLRLLRPGRAGERPRDSELVSLRYGQRGVCTSRRSHQQRGGEVDRALRRRLSGVQEADGEILPTTAGEQLNACGWHFIPV